MDSTRTKKTYVLGQKSKVTHNFNAGTKNETKQNGLITKKKKCPIFRDHRYILNLPNYITA